MRIIVKPIEVLAVKIDFAGDRKNNVGTHVPRNLKKGDAEPPTA